jgi:hypothetical protein
MTVSPPATLTGMFCIRLLTTSKGFETTLAAKELACV